MRWTLKLSLVTKQLEKQTEIASCKLKLEFLVLEERVKEFEKMFKETSQSKKTEKLDIKETGSTKRAREDSPVPVKSTLTIAAPEFVPSTSKAETASPTIKKAKIEIIEPAVVEPTAVETPTEVTIIEDEEGDYEEPEEYELEEEVHEAQGVHEVVHEAAQETHEEVEPASEYELDGNATGDEFADEELNEELEEGTYEEEPEIDEPMDEDGEETYELIEQEIKSVEPSPASKFAEPERPASPLKLEKLSSADVAKLVDEEMKPSEELKKEPEPEIEPIVEPIAYTLKVEEQDPARSEVISPSQMTPKHEEEPAKEKKTEEKTPFKISPILPPAPTIPAQPATQAKPKEEKPPVIDMATRLAEKTALLKRKIAAEQEMASLAAAESTMQARRAKLTRPVSSTILGGKGMINKIESSSPVPAETTAAARLVAGALPTAATRGRGAARGARGQIRQV